MIGFWHRTRALRGKVTDSNDVYALEYSWCEFVRRWNACREGGSRFLDWLDLEEDRRQLWSLGALCERVCELAWDKDRLCYDSINEFCRFCTQSGARPTCPDCDAQVVERRLGYRQREWVGRYGRAFWEHGDTARRRMPARTRRPARAERGRSWKRTRIRVAPIARRAFDPAALFLRVGSGRVFTTRASLIVVTSDARGHDLIFSVAGAFGR